MTTTTTSSGDETEPTLPDLTIIVRRCEEHPDKFEAECLMEHVRIGVGDDVWDAIVDSLNELGERLIELYEHGQNVEVNTEHVSAEVSRFRANNARLQNGLVEFTAEFHDGLSIDIIVYISDDCPMPQQFVQDKMIAVNFDGDSITLEHAEHGYGLQ